MASNTPLEIGPDGLVKESPVIAYTEMKIEEEQLQLRKYIEEKYSSIRDVERELTNLSLEMKLTAGPKKAALEHLRKKVEMATERIRVAKVKEEQAKKAWEAAAKVVKDEEAMKQKLCEDLNNLVQESSNYQIARLEELKKRLEALNPSRASASVPQMQDVQAYLHRTDRRDEKLIATVPSSTSAVASTAEPRGSINENAPKQGNTVNAPVVNGHNQQPALEEEGRGKKKTHFQGRGKGGIRAMPKGRGPQAPGWTGSGFDVDDRS